MSMKRSEVNARRRIIRNEILPEIAVLRLRLKIATQAAAALRVKIHQLGAEARQVRYGR